MDKSVRDSIIRDVNYVLLDGEKTGRVSGIDFYYGSPHGTQKLFVKFAFDILQTPTEVIKRVGEFGGVDEVTFELEDNKDVVVRGIESEDLDVGFKFKLHELSFVHFDFSAQAQMNPMDTDEKIVFFVDTHTVSE